MKQLKKASMLLLLLSSSVFAQEKAITFGFVASQFHNYKADQGMSSLQNPLGSGIMLGYRFQKYAAVSMIGEYMKDDLSNNVKVSDLRVILLMHAFPYQWKNFHPYLSGGLVYLRNSLETGLVEDEVSTSLQIRQSIGLDYQLSSKVSLIFDLAAYSDGFNYLGHANSFCVRYSL